jgi:hypothetical protein
VPTGDLKRFLHSAIGFSPFRPNQEAVRHAGVEGRDVLLVMPTGTGKSLCYQLPGMARGGTILVISPSSVVHHGSASSEAWNPWSSDTLRWRGSSLASGAECTRADIP